ncbi:hypothetical protein PPYR_00966 [Photinus pyralis]|uniref:Protein misato n=1 Tax=Photinus pyralis TaxID=7054 RepID=A0A5N4B353_PHOPY|nr:protein misato isoform X2 [Photinus pyralis]KAB0803996.1 hypothetical protein PPYR_00966 [Photinus pyralis]
METREILSLQFGHYSNFIGTHSWNIQETGFAYNSKTPSEINHDVLFREGVTLKGEVTYTPRLLLVDLKGSLGTLPENGTLYDPPTHSSTVETWKQGVEVKKADKLPKNQFQEELDTHNCLKKNVRLDSEVHVWSDFLYSRFHPRTVNIIKQYAHGGESEFDVFPLGAMLWKTDQFEEEFADKIRNYVEECDSFQGFHVTLDATNGFSGLTSSCLEYINDEYERKSVLAFPVIPSRYVDDEEERRPLKDSICVMNLALAFEMLRERTSLFVPLCTGATGWRKPGEPRKFHHVSYNHNLNYHSSAILASALDTITLKHRLKSSHYSLGDFCAYFNTHGRAAAAASVCLPFSLSKNGDFIDCLDNWEGPLTQSITPNCTIGTDKLVQMFTLRGIWEDRLKRPLSQANKQILMPAYNCNTVNEMLSFYLSCNYYFCLNNVTTVAQGISVKTPFPDIFDEFVGVDGNICADSRRRDAVIESVPILAGLHSGVEIGSMLDSLHQEAKKLRSPHKQQFITAGLEEMELSESLDKLLELKECYEDNIN